ncbi:MAG: hypothetical protein KME21_28110 [Desmonostoc vinosum HA7617-LM4]|jgi:hypothetical protein|nr:hypothetical protein [Desmonostoc vinosum HA7617-LM4]
MNLDNFESQYRETISETLNELQAAVLLLEQLQRKISNIGSTVQLLSENVEEFITQQQEK